MQSLPRIQACTTRRSAHCAICFNASLWSANGGRGGASERTRESTNIVLSTCVRAWRASECSLLPMGGELFVCVFVCVVYVFV
jgi:hypothetical protein